MKQSTFMHTFFAFSLKIREDEPMHVKILGCHGGETPQHLTTCFLINDQLCIDAGAICRSLDLEGQRAIEHILVSHSHMDHVKDLALLADQIIGSKTNTVRLHCGPKTAKTLQESYFNNLIWPDFTMIPTQKNPVMQVISHQAEEKFKLNIKEEDIEIQFVPVNHPVESMAMILSSKNAAFAYTSDTGPTKRFWKILNQVQNLKALFCEISFPNALQQLADISGHFTPASLANELKKWDAYGKVPLCLYHLKPTSETKTREEIEQLKLKNMHIVNVSEEFNF